MRKGNSIFERIREQVAASPTAALDDSKFPKIAGSKAAGGKIQFAPGLLDRMDRKDSGNPDQVLRLVEQVRSGSIRDWAPLDKVLSRILAANNMKPVLLGLNQRDITPDVARLFWEVSRRSASYESVKWGILIASLRLEKGDVENLLLFARHGEFTPFVISAIQHASQDAPHYARVLVRLLPFTRQWATVDLVLAICANQDLIQDPDVQRQLVIFGVPNAGAVSMEAAFPVAEHVDLGRFLREATTSEEIRKSLVELYSTLLFEPEPVGGIDDLPNGPDILSRYLFALIRWPNDFSTLRGLFEIDRFLAKDPEHICSSLRKRARAAFDRKFSLKVLRTAVADESQSWDALKIVRELRLSQLADEVKAEFEKDPRSNVIETLRIVGNRGHLERLVAAIPKAAEIEKRRRLNRRPRRQRPFPGGHRAFEFAALLRACGQLGSPRAIHWIKEGASDPDPVVAAGAYEGIALLPVDRWDLELRRIVLSGLRDRRNMVLESAAGAALKGALRLPSAKIEAIIARLPYPGKSLPERLRRLSL